VSWFNFVDELALLHVGTSMISASALVGTSTVSFQAPIPSIVVETTRVAFEPWNVDRFDTSRCRLTQLRTQGVKLSESWIHNVIQDVCGYDHIVESICSLCKSALLAENPRSSSLLPLGFLIWGGHGTGKSALLASATKHAGINTVAMDCSAVFSSGEGDAERLIGSHFERARSLAPCILVLDDLDMIAPARHDISGGSLHPCVSCCPYLKRSFLLCMTEMERRVISRILGEMDSLRKSKDQQPVFIFASARSPDRLDASLLAPRRIEQCFELRPPLPRQRRQILETKARDIPFTPHAEKSSILDFVAANSHGRVGADLESICRSALTRAIIRSPHDARVSQGDFEQAMNSVGASSLAEMSRGSWTDGASTFSRRLTTFADIGGLKKQISELMVNVVLPFKDPSKLTNLGIRAPKGILITGPSGTGKTLLANAAIIETGVNSISISGTELLSQYVGDSEKRLAELFKRARASAPCIVFIDQFESIARERGQDSSEDQSADRVLSALLTELDGVTDSSTKPDETVMLLAATSRPELLDSAVKRPGRIDCIVHTTLLDKEGRRDVLSRQLGRCKKLLPENELDSLAAKTAGLSGADLVNLVREAAYASIRESMKSEEDSELEMRHLQQALDEVYNGGSADSGLTQSPFGFGQSPFGFGPSPFAQIPSSVSSTPKFTM
jgi:transitional endoplasmic reticulum ATPase